jgi:P-type Ca2+ transporter type 2C
VKPVESSIYWHQKNIEQAMGDLRSSLKGLSAAEAEKRLEEHGPNVLRETKKKSPFAMFLDQFKDFMILVLIAAAVISGIIGDTTDTIAIMTIVVLNAVIGFVQEYRAEKAMAALKKMAAPTALVVRDGIPVNIAASRLVPGDVVILEAGKVIPADLRLLESALLKIEEAALTGESVPVEKGTEALPDSGLSLGDRTNMGYKGTVVSYGRGIGLVVAAGMDTELGRIATMLQAEDEVKTPLQKRLAVFGQKLALAVIAICVVVFAVGIIRGEPALLMFLTAIALAVAAIPEALPAVVTISLALGAKKMVQQRALIRKLPAVETLGSVTYICSDKTGTLTLNKMTAEELFVEDKLIKVDTRFFEGEGIRHDSPLGLLLLGGILNNDASADKDGTVIGDPTEAALYQLAESAGLRKEVLLTHYSRIAEIPFDSERKCMTTFHRWADSGTVSFTKGALELLLEKSSGILSSEGVKSIETAEVIRTSERMAADGLRVLGVAMRRWDQLPSDISPDSVETGLTLVGLVGIMDPPRAEAMEAVSLCRSAGIRPVMITGDHPITARAIARRLGILEDEDGVVTGRQLERWTLEEFEEKVEDVRVYARVAPEQKLKIVRALQDRGQFVAMTGDGVNDAPALKRADIGVAMGVTGTDVAKESAHMILLDDNFATIVKAVRQGRRLFDNIRKFIKYTMTSNSGEIWTIFLAPLVGLPLPLLPIHILWINLVTDGLPGLALAAEPEEKGIMSRPPRHPQESIFSHGMGTHILWVGLLMGGICLLIQAWAIKTGHAHWQTMVFTVLCLSQMGHVMAIRSESESLFKIGLFSNRPLLGAFTLTFALQMATIYVPVLNPIFKTEPLTATELIVALAASSVVFFAVEIEKAWKRSFRKEPMETKPLIRGR